MDTAVGEPGRTLWVTAYTMLLDVVVDLGVSVLFSRQVVDVGSEATRACKALSSRRFRNQCDMSMGSDI